MIVNVDAKALEWCTELFLSQDKVGIEEWQGVIDDPTKNDIHKANQTAFNLPSRLVAKVFLFRWIYRGTAYAYSMDNDFKGVSKKVDFWQDVIDKYYLKYNGIFDFHMRIIKEAKRTGLITSPIGRSYRYEPKVNWRGELQWSEPDITNYINQGLGADVMAVVRVAIRQRMIRASLKSKLILTVHDSIVADCPEEEVKPVASLFDKTFRELPRLITQAYGIDWNVPMMGEVSVGQNMLELTELKL